MSEYQYYEFRALDNRLTPEQVRELRQLSSRAEITPYGFTNTYNYGDFRGDPDELMDEYFDAHIYVSNFGSLRFVLRFPKSFVTEDIIAPYGWEDGPGGRTAGNYTILEWNRVDEPSGVWVQGEEWMDRLLPVREEIMRGDFRSFYIGWLAPGMNRDYNNDEPGPPIPAGLSELTDAQQALAEFLQVDEDLIAAAAEHSPARKRDSGPAQPASEWVSALSEAEVRELVLRVVQGEGLQVQVELQARYLRSGKKDTGLAEGVGPSYRALLTRAEEVEHVRKRREAEEEAEHRRLKAEEDARKRYQYLQAVIPRVPQLWIRIHQLGEEKTASAYETATTLLVDIRDAYRQAKRDDFMDEFAPFVQQYSRKTALMRRLKEARLPVDEAQNHHLRVAE